MCEPGAWSQERTRPVSWVVEGVASSSEGVLGVRRGTLKVLQGVVVALNCVLFPRAARLAQAAQGPQQLAELRAGPMRCLSALVLVNAARLYRPEVPHPTHCRKW